MSSNLERRACRSPLELREGADGNGTLTGYAILFNTPSQDLGGYRETIAPGAVDLAAARDVKFLVGHDDALILGRTQNETLMLAIDDRGVSFTLALPGTSLAKDTRELVKLGTLDAMSFGFRTVKDSWSSDRRARTVERLQLFEISAVAFPAYEATVVEARDVTDARAHTRLLLQDHRRELADVRLAPHRRALELAERRHAIVRAAATGTVRRPVEHVRV